MSSEPLIPLVKGRENTTGKENYTLIGLTVNRSLQQRVKYLKLEGIVLFNDTFLSDSDLWSVLSSADVYINSYTDEVASVSGSTLQYYFLDDFD